MSDNRLPDPVEILGPKCVPVIDLDYDKLSDSYERV